MAKITVLFASTVEPWVEVQTAVGPQLSLVAVHVVKYPISYNEKLVNAADLIRGRWWAVAPFGT